MKNDMLLHINMCKLDALGQFAHAHLHSDRVLYSGFHPDNFGEVFTELIEGL